MRKAETVNASLTRIGQQVMPIKLRKEAFMAISRKKMARYA